MQPEMSSYFAVNVGWLPELRERSGRAGVPPHDDFAEAMYRLRRRAAAAFMMTNPSGSIDARSLRRVIRFQRRIRRRSIDECECLGLGLKCGGLL